MIPQWVQRFAALTELDITANLSIGHMRDGGLRWCCRCGQLSRVVGTILIGGNGVGDTPEEAVEDFWAAYVTTNPGNIRLTENHYRTETDVVWDGAAWAKSHTRRIYQIGDARGE